MNDCLIVSRRMGVLALLVLSASACSQKPSATELFQLQKQCAEAAKQFFDTDLRKPDNPPDLIITTDDYYAHYSLTREKCYVEQITTTGTIVRDEHNLIDQQDLTKERAVYDVFDRTPPVVLFEDTRHNAPKPEASSAQRKALPLLWLPGSPDSGWTSSHSISCYYSGVGPAYTTRRCPGGDTVAGYMEARKPYMEQ